MDKQGPGSRIDSLFDALHAFWERASTERVFGLILIWVYLAALGAVELHRQGLYPDFLPEPPSSHYYSIQLAFTLILGLEVIGLIFVLPASLSRCMGKQMEILTLILLRNAFKELAILPEPVAITWEDIMPVVDIGVSALGALCVFLSLGIFRKIVRPQRFVRSAEMLAHYVTSKKLLALVLLGLFLGLGLRDLWLFAQGEPKDFFETFYTILIFADITMVLIAQRYTPCYHAVFRNSGFVIGTLMMRLALSAPPLLCSAIAVFAGLYVIALTWGANKFMPNYEDDA